MQIDNDVDGSDGVGVHFNCGDGNESVAATIDFGENESMITQFSIPSTVTYFDQPRQSSSSPHANDNLLEVEVEEEKKLHDPYADTDSDELFDYDFENLSSSFPGM